MDVDVDVEEEEEEEDDDVEEEKGSQDRGAHFVRACAVEMHMDMSQEPFCVENKTSAGPQSRGHRFVRACAVETHTGISEEPFCMDIVLREPAQSKCIWTCYKSLLMWKFKAIGQMVPPR